MLQRDRFRWMWSFCGAMLPAALTAWMLAGHLDATYAVGLAYHEEGTNISALRTSEALRVDDRVIDAGHLVQGDEVQVDVRIQNIWERPLDIGVDLENLAGWTALLDNPVLDAGESTTLYLIGHAQEPGALAGTARITALGEFLELQVAVIGEVAPKIQALPIEEPSTEEPSPDRIAIDQPEAPHPIRRLPEQPALDETSIDEEEGE